MERKQGASHIEIIEESGSFQRRGGRKQGAAQSRHGHERNNARLERARIPQRRSRPALDLTEEAKKARLHGDAYLPDFLKQMRSFAKETDSTGRIFSYQHIIQRDSDGKARLYITEGSMLVSARKSYLQPALDPGLSEWERERYYREYQAVCAMEDMLSYPMMHTDQSQDDTYTRGDRISAGEAIVEASPAPFNIDETELDGTFYGAFSFFRIHTLTRDDQGREVLAGRQVLHYLDWETQRELFAALTGREDVSKEDLLGTVARLNPNDGYEGIQSIEDIALLINDIDGHKLGENRDVMYRSEEEVDAFLSDLDVMAKDIFKLIREGASKQRVMDLVQDYRQLVRDYCAGSDKALDALSAYKASRGGKVVGKAYGGGYVFAERYNSCGAGVGYDEYGPAPYGDVVHIHGRASFAKLAEYIAKADSLPGDLRIVKCPGSGRDKCGKPVIFSRRDVLKHKKLACPCGACASGCNAEVIADNARPISRQDALKVAHNAYFFKAA